jgi:hypothetical protein
VSGLTFRSTGTTGSALADGYKNAAKVVRDAPLPTAFDASRYSISAATFANCHIKRETWTFSTDTPTP